MEIAVSSLVAADLVEATGASLMGEIEMLIVAVLESTLPSLALKVKESAPLASAAGV